MSTTKGKQKETVRYPANRSEINLSLELAAGSPLLRAELMASVLRHVKAGSYDAAAEALEIVKVIDLRAGWIHWCRWGGRDECISDYMRKGFDEAAHYNDHGGGCRPCSEDAFDEYPNPTR